MKRVLVPTDFSEHADRALAVAIGFAKPLGATIDLLHVYALPMSAPVLNTPPGPSAGKVKLTVAPSTGRPVSSVTSTVSPRVAREPIAYAAPSPSATRIVRIDGASAPQAKAAAKVARSHGYNAAAPAESFYVVDVDGPLLDGETDRATAWGRRLATSMKAAMR